MYNISQELKDKLNSNAIISTARLTFSNPHFVIDGSNLVSVKIKDYCYNEGRIIGTNIAKDVEIIIQNDNYNLQDKEFFLEIGVLLDNNDYEYIPYGYYIIDTVEDTKSNNQYKITAMDYMIKLNTDFVEFDASEYPMTMRQFLNKFAEQCGIELAEQTLPNETLVIPSMPYFTKTSRRTILKQIAEVFGRFAKFNRLGQLEFRLKNETDEKITKANMNSKLEVDKQYGEVNVVSILLSDDVTGENATLRDEESIVSPKGKNKFNIDTYTPTDNSPYVTIDEDNWVTITYDNSAGTDVKYIQFYTENLKLKTNTEYSIIGEIKNISGNGVIGLISRNYVTPQTQGQFTFEGSKGIAFKDITSNSTIKVTATTLSSFNNVVYGLRTLVTFYAGQSGSITFRLSTIEGGDVSTDNFVYEPFEYVGENIIKIVGNEFLSTAKLRETAVVELFNDLKGFKYIPTSFKYMGKPYLDCGDGIQVQGMNGEYYESIVLNNYIEVPTLRQSKMENLALTKTQVNNQYVLPLEERVSKTEFNVNKVDKQITLVVEEQTSQANEINNVANNLNTFINETYAGDISNLQEQIDGAIQFWNGESIPTLSNYPASEWTTEEQRNNHRADIYTVIQDIDGEMKQGKSYRFDKVGTTWQWVELTDNELSAVQALASSKAKVYVTTPTVPYNVGDLWLKDEELYECITAKDASGSYSASDWVKATKYTDDTKANEVAEDLIQTNSKVSTIEQNLDSITERVEATETGIQENTESINQIENEILLTDTFERQKDFQIDAAENILTDVKVYGELEQDTKVSSNILKSFSAGETDYFTSLTNVYTSDTNYYKAEPLADSWIHVECDLTGLTSGPKYINHFISPNKIPKLKTSTTYTIIYEFRNVDITTMSENLNTLRTQGNTFDKYFGGIQAITNANIQKYNNSMYKITKATLSEFSGNIALRNFHTINAGDKFSYDYRISVLEGNKLSEDYTYEEYANRPSPEEEARITVIGDNINYFDYKNSFVRVSNPVDKHTVIEKGNRITIGAATTYIHSIFSLENSTDFLGKKIRLSGKITPSGTNNGAIRLWYADNNNSLVGGLVGEILQTGEKTIDVPSKFPANATRFVILLYGNVSSGTSKIGDYVDYTDVKLEIGEKTTGWTPYNCGGIDYKNIGKNILPNSATTITSNGLTFTVNSDGSITITGASTARTLFNINSTKRIKLQQCKYTLSKFGDTNNFIETYLRKGSVSELLASIAATNSKITFTNNYTDEVFVYIAIPSGVTINETISIQLETGTEQTEYEPYKEIIETIVLPENEFMAKIDTYEDYIEGNILHKKIGELVLDGTENWLYYAGFADSGGVGYCYQIIDSTFALGIGISKCSHFRNVTNSYMGSIGYVGSYCDHLTVTRKYFISDKTTLEEWKSWLAEQYNAGTPVTLYYVLAEEYTRQLDKYTLPTMKGINNISISAPLSATYYTNVDINSALTSKAEYAEQVIRVDEISTRVSSTETTVANQSNDISNINDNIGSLNNSVNANQQEITLIKEDYTDLKQTVDGFDFTVVDRIQQQIANGEITSNVVKTTTVAIDADGIKVAKSGSEMQSLLDNEGFYVNKGNIDKTETKNNILTVDKDGVVTENLYVRTYLTAGYHRTEGYIENGKKRTGVFYQGGVDD